MLAKNLCEEFEDFIPFRLKIHIFVHIVDGTSWFGFVDFLDVSQFKYCNYDFNEFIKMTSMRCRSRLEETVKVMSLSVLIEKT